jgi:hypothetical protein
VAHSNAPPVSDISCAHILVNGVKVGDSTSASIPVDPCLYRSATTAGEWHYFEYAVGNGTLKEEKIFYDNEEYPLGWLHLG